MSFEKHRNGRVLHLLKTFRVPKRVTLQVAEETLSALDCPRSLAAYLLLKYQEFDQLIALECDPRHYNSVEEFRNAYQATRLLSKNNFLKLSVDRKEVALKKFSQMEELCRQTNSRFRDLALDPNFHGANVSLLNAMVQKIARLLGDYTADEFFESANWGPGVSTLIKGEHVSAVNKFQSETGITRDLYALMSSEILSGAYPRWQEHLQTLEGYPTLEVGNVIITVPKDAKTDRVIAIEPGLNLWFQKAIGTMIRRRLQRRGIDLNQQIRNQQLAKRASFDDSLATVDFSSASDSISRKVVEAVLPPHWFSLLDTCRSHYGNQGDRPRLWNKFSSMGNGFTFELESLIFWAAAAAVCEHLSVPAEISVFGDDVVIPRECFDLFSSFTRFLGFEVNMKKSFSSGPFRESCGSYFFDGVDVKPIFIKEMAQDPLRVFRLANSIRRLAKRRNCNYGCDVRLHGAWSLCVDSLPEPLRRFRIDDSLGDGGLISNFDEAAPSRARFDVEGYYVRQVAHVGVTHSVEQVGLLLARLKSASAQEYGNSYTLRGRTKLIVAWSLVARWTDLGPWI